MAYASFIFTPGQFRIAVSLVLTLYIWNLYESLSLRPKKYSIAGKCFVLFVFLTRHVSVQTCYRFYTATTAFLKIQEIIKTFHDKAYVKNYIAMELM